MLSWMPQLVADAGFSEAQGTLVSATASICGVVGGVLLGWLGSRYAIKPFVVATIICMGLATLAFGAVPDKLVFLVVAAGVTGFFLYPGAVGIFNVIADFFPAESRITGSGFVMGVGRGGSAVAPLLAGYLFQAGFDRGEVSAVMASCAIVGGILLAFLKVGPSRQAPALTPSQANT
jgi:MFS family permease